ncbi:hypothetical protein [Rufibacter roseus]|uniref:Uncharacterized protein n=1 Tax=Rufibacter roseus TaxID=1567108 RepID=A0ABW2DJM6_9BACT|nr:hypothetical protein [Rufibacter roseus]
MPINELERHPYLNYLEDFNVVPKPAYSGIIIGSFPIYACTDTLDINLNVIQQRLNLNEVKMRFFYGSKKSNLWKYSTAAFGVLDPTLAMAGDNLTSLPDLVRERTIDFLQSNDLLITDVILRTNRRKKSSEDSNLWITDDGVNQNIKDNLQLNYNLRNTLERFPTINNLYFTANGIDGKSPFGWFRSLFDNLEIHEPRVIGGRTWGFTCIVENRTYKVFLLPTPKTRGIHFTDNRRVEMFANFLQSTNIELYISIDNVPQSLWTPMQKYELTEAREEFLIECYRQALVLNNLDFTGFVNN